MPSERARIPARRTCLSLLGALLLAAPATADPAHVTGARLTRRPYGRWEIVVALEHEDQGRRHLCDRLDALDQDGQRVFYWYFRTPKPKDVEEDGPIRRKLGPVALPEAVTRLTLKAHCKRSGWGGKPLEIDLGLRQGPGYRIESQRHPYLADFEGFATGPQLRTWRKRLLARPLRNPFPPRGPISATPPEPVDARPQAKDLARIQRYRPGPPPADSPRFPWAAGESAGEGIGDP